MASLVEEVYASFQENTDIDELGVILSPAPPNVICTENKLGISMTVLKPMFSYAVPRLYSVGLEFKRCKTHELAQELLKLTLAILVVKGDFPPALNMRKELIVYGHLDPLNEMHVLEVILSKHPKSPSCWHHRKWCMLQLSEKNILPISHIVHQECSLCSRSCDLYPKNYYAWNHRLWITENMNENELHEELEWTGRWLRKHVSDHSAVSHYTQVVLLLSKLGVHVMPKAVREGVELVGKCAGHESLWYLRRTLASILIDRVTHDMPSCETYEVIQQPDCSKWKNILYHCISEASDLEIRSDDSDDEDLNVEYHMNKLSTLFSTFPNCECDISPSELANSFLVWVNCWLEFEVKFVVACINDDSSWDPETQRRQGVLYLAHIFHKLANAFCISGEQEADRCTRTNDDTPTLKNTLSESLQNICRYISSDPTIESNSKMKWKYFLDHWRSN